MVQKTYLALTLALTLTTTLTITMTCRQGLRIDYVLTDPRHVKAENGATETRDLPDAFIDETILHPFSDHCPVGAVVDI